MVRRSRSVRGPAAQIERPKKWNCVTVWARSAVFPLPLSPCRRIFREWQALGKSGEIPDGRISCKISVSLSWKVVHLSLLDVRYLMTRRYCVGLLLVLSALSLCVYATDPKPDD